MDKDKRTKPFLKWAGNKYRVLDNIFQVLPEGKRLVEPFVGAGALFLNSDYPRYLLNDTNPDLINLYKIVKASGEDFIRDAAKYFTKAHNKDTRYYQLRKRFNNTKDIYARALLFLYLNRHGYNGLCRYNRQGGFNVPFGRYKKPYFPENELWHFHRKAQKASFKCLDFLDVMQKFCKQGDIVYCDPPYAPLSKTADFTQYARQGFSIAEQETLAEAAKTLAKRKIPVLLSNHDTPFVNKIYHGADFNRFKVPRYISCQGNKRTPAKELLVLYA